MTDKQINQISGLSMGQLLSEYAYERPEKGDFMDAEVMQIECDRILMDLGAKTDAVVSRGELKRTDDDILEDLSEGDIIQVYVLQPPSMLQKPQVSIQRGLEKTDWDRAEVMEKNGTIEKFTITGKNKGGLLVQFGRLEGFVPASLMPTVSRAPGRKIAEKIKANLVGEEIYLKVIQADARRRKLILSARESEDEIARARMRELEPGTVVNGIVVNLVDYGAFIDLFGVDGLLHISELEWVRTSDPAEVLELGQKLEVKVLDLDPEEERISLSRKALLDPIETLAIEPEAAG